MVALTNVASESGVKLLVQAATAPFKLPTQLRSAQAVLEKTRSEDAEAWPLEGRSRFERPAFGKGPPERCKIRPSDMD